MHAAFANKIANKGKIRRLSDRKIGREIVAAANLGKFSLETAQMAEDHARYIAQELISFGYNAYPQMRSPDIKGDPVLYSVMISWH